MSMYTYSTVVIECQYIDGARETKSLPTPVLGTRATLITLSDYVVTLDGLLVTLCAAVKNLGVIIDFSYTFETQGDNVSRIAFFISEILLS